MSTENNGKKLTLIWEDAEGGSVYPVDAEGMTRFARDALNNMETEDAYVKDFGLPMIKLEMWTPEQWAEADRLGEEMA